MADIGVVIDTRRLDQLDREVPGRADRLVGKLAFYFEGQAKQYAPVDTGNLKNSIHAERIAPRRWQILDGTDYGIFPEFGTRYQAAQPFFTPAAEDTAQVVAEVFRALLE